MARWRQVGTAFVLATAIIGLGQRCRSDDTEADVQWYARPVELGEATQQLFDDTGANVVSYRFRVPPDTKLVVVLIATDENGKRIEELTKTYTRTPDGPGEPLETSFRLVHIDPSHFVENYK